MAGTPEKMLEYLLETRIDSVKDDSLPDTFLEDFLLTHLVFMPANVLCNALMHYYRHAVVSFRPNTVNSFIANSFASACKYDPLAPLGKGDGMGAGGNPFNHILVQAWANFSKI